MNFTDIYKARVEWLFPLLILSTEMVDSMKKILQKLFSSMLQKR